MSYILIYLYINVCTINAYYIYGYSYKRPSRGETKPLSDTFFGGELTIDDIFRFVRRNQDLIDENGVLNPDG